MAVKSLTTTTYTCDWKCGATADVIDRTSLNHAGVPMGWEKIYRVPSGYLTTDDDKAKIPYILCPKCWKLYTIAAQADTPKGQRFRQYVEAFWEAEEVLASKCIDVKIQGGGGGGWPGGGGAGLGCGVPGCNLPAGHGHGGGGGGGR
jgi:hypothetical protein